MHRNQSIDEGFEELVGLRSQLQTVLQSFEDLKEQYISINGDPAVFHRLEVTFLQEVRPSIAIIMEHISKFADIWSQNSGAATV
jgi:hypothetical protein